MKEADFPACPKRTRLVMFTADGSKDHVFRCTEQDAPVANTDVTPDVCLACPIRQTLMSVDYVPPSKRLEGKPKPDHGGDGFVKCELRGVVTVKACCGATRTARVCQNDLAVYYQGEVNQSICANCPVRTSRG